MRVRLFIFINFLIVVNIFQVFSFAHAQTTISPTTTSLSENLNSFRVMKIKVQGNTVFEQKEIEALMPSELDKNFTYEQIGQVAKKITALYLTNGYLTSGAFFPQQEIIDGEVFIRVVEGKLERVEIRGLEKLNEDYLLSLVHWNSKVPLNVQRLQDRIKLIQQDPLIKKLDAQLVEGSSFGQSILLLNVVEASPWTATLTANNHNSANSGEFQGIASIAHQNLFGFRERLGLDYNLTEGFDALNLASSLPLNTKGSELSLEYREGDNEITQSDFKDFGIRADGSTLRLQFAQSLVREINRDWGLFIALDRRISNTFIEDDIPFSFTEGTDEGRSRITALRLGGSWTRRSQTLVTAAQTQLSLGLDLFDPTINENTADGIFFSWLGQFQMVKALNEKQDILLVTRLAAQLSPDALLPLEQISIGGASTVRGYRENRGVGDNGILGTFELQLPLVQDSQVGDLTLVPFFDAGTIWDIESDESLTLASLGLGIDWKIKEWFLVELDWGIPLIETSDFDNSLQDSGIHFQVQLNPF